MSSDHPGQPGDEDRTVPLDAPGSTGGTPPEPEPVEEPVVEEPAVAAPPPEAADEVAEPGPDEAPPHATVPPPTDPAAPSSAPPPPPPLPPPPSVSGGGAVPPPPGGGAPPPGATPPPPPAPYGAASGRAAGAVLRRSTDDRVLAGVCGGIGRYFGIDPVLIRIAFVVLTLAGGAGVLAYLIGWVAIPEERPGEHATTAVASRPPDATTASLLIGGVLVVAGAFLLADRLVPSLGRFMWPLILIGLGVAIVVGGRR